MVFIEVLIVIMNTVTSPLIFFPHIHKYTYILQSVLEVFKKVMIVFLQSHHCFFLLFLCLNLTCQMKCFLTCIHLVKSQ